MSEVSTNTQPVLLSFDKEKELLPQIIAAIHHTRGEDRIVETPAEHRSQTYLTNSHPHHRVFIVRSSTNDPPGRWLDRVVVGKRHLLIMAMDTTSFISVQELERLLDTMDQ